MAREKAKKDPADYSVEEKLKNLYALQSMLSEIDSIKTIRGELPLEVQDLEDEIEGMTTRIEKIGNDITELKKQRVADSQFRFNAKDFPQAEVIDLR